jgi:glutathione-regulated potassium-efflux system ancillary protein KefF
MTLVVLAHPYPDRSQANRALLRALEGLGNLQVRSLYDLYPDFAIDAAAERDALAAASIVVWQHPLFWYGVPALLKLWFEKVLTSGWAWGPGGDALRGKRCLWVVTTGGDALDYSPAGIHRHAVDAFAPAVRQTAEFCGMVWLEPVIVQAARQLDAAALAERGRRYRARLEALASESRGDGSR